jgi:hypothetical protein
MRTVLQELQRVIGYSIPQEEFVGSLKQACEAHLSDGGRISPFSNEEGDGVMIRMQFLNREREQTVLLRLERDPQRKNLCNPFFSFPGPGAVTPVVRCTDTRGEKLVRIQINTLFQEAGRREEVFSQEVLEFLTGERCSKGATLLKETVHWKTNVRRPPAYTSPFEQALEDLAAMARRESWGSGYSVLRSYLLQTFRRALVLQKQSNERSDGRTYIAVSRDRRRFCFHTGLYTMALEDEAIYAVFYHKDSEPFDNQTCWWNFERWCIWSDLTARFERPPERVFYHENFLELIYNPDINIAYNVNHILNNREGSGRVQEALPGRTQLQLREDLRHAIERGKFYAQRNYRVVVPHYFPRARRVQLLLPLYFHVDDKTPQLVLCLEARHRGSPATLSPAELHDLDPNRHEYWGPTVLTLGMAYNNARLLFEVESNWLKCPSEGNDNDDAREDEDDEYHVT